MCRVAYGIAIFSILFARLSDCVHFDQPLSIFIKQDIEAEISCRHDDNDLDIMLWYQQLHNSKSLALIGYSYGKADPAYEPEFQKRFKMTRDDTVNGALKISNLSLSDSAVYYCAAKPGYGNPAYFGNGTKLTVLDPDVAINKPDVKILNETRCKEKVTLVCLAENFYPDHVSIKWTDGSKNITEDVATDPYATQDEKTKMFRISSRLKVPKKKFTPKSTFKCTVTFYSATDVSEDESAEIKGTGGGGYEPEDYLKSSKTMKLAYVVFIAKSALYGLVIFVFVLRKGSCGK